MTISTELRKAGPFTGNGVTTAFPFSFKVFAATDATVTVANTQGNESVLALGADYAVALNADQDAAPGGTVTLAAPLASGHRLVVSSAVPNLQPTDITNNGGFYPRVIEDALDRHVAQIQQIDEKVGRALKVAVTSPLGDQALPSPVAGMLIGWNESNDGLTNYAPIGGTLLGQQLAAADGSSLVGFRQASAGAVVRTAQDKMREVVSVKDFGALGDGITNDTTAIQAALSSGKYQIYFPAGTYLVSGTLTAFSNGMILRGDGMVRTVIKQTNAALSTPTLRTDPANSRLFAFEISDLRIEQPDGATNTALQINNPNFRCVVERVRVDCGSGASSSGTAIHIKRASDATDGYFTTIHNCWVDKHAYGIWIEGAAPGSANVHWITQTTVTSAASFGVWIKNAGSVYVSHGHIELCGTGVYGESVGNLVVDKNYFERNSNFDVDLLSGNSCLVEGNQHNSSAYANASGSAIRLQAGEHHRIRDNWFNERFSSYDVRISAGVNNTSIIGNVAKDRDIDGGWKSSGPVVEDNGTATFYANTQYTPGGARRFLFDGPAVHDAPELTRPLISRVNGSDPMPEILSGSNNPSIAPGVAANIGSIYLRNGSFPGFWQKTSSADTGWAQIT